MTPPQEQLLHDALKNARALLLDLRRQQADLLKHPDKLPPDRLAEGTAALEAAAQAARRTIEYLERLTSA